MSVITPSLPIFKPSRAESLGLVAHYPCYEGSGDVIHDATYNKRHLAVTNIAASPWNRGPRGWVFLFSETDDYASTSDIPVAAAPLTMMAWVYTTSNTVISNVMMIGDASAADHWFALNLRGDVGGDPVEAQARDGSTGAARTGGTYSINTWHHVAAVFSSTTSRTAYLDTIPSTPDTTAITPAGLDIFSIGELRDSSPSGNWIGGRIYDARVYNRALTRDEIALAMSGLDLNPVAHNFYIPFLFPQSVPPNVSSSSFNAQSLWLIDSKATSGDGKTFVPYMDQVLNDIEVATFTHSTTIWTTNDTTSNVGTNGNAHCSPSILLDSAGRLNIAFGSYTGATWVKFRRSTTAHDASAWGSEITVDNGSGSETSFTYPKLLQLSGGNLVCFYRALDAGDSSVFRQVSTDNGATWSNKQKILSMLTADDRIYYLARLGDSDRVHICWNHFDNTDGENEDIYYAYSDNADAATSAWKEADGTAVTLPAGELASALALDSSAAGWDSCYLLGMAIESGNVPHIVTHVRDATTTDELIHLDWNGSSWDSVTIEASNEFGPATASPVFGVEPADGDLTYDGTTLMCATVFRANDQGEIYEYRSTDNGATWSSRRQLTAASVSHYADVTYPDGDRLSNVNHVIGLYGAVHHNDAKELVAIEFEGALSVASISQGIHPVETGLYTQGLHYIGN